MTAPGDAPVRLHNLAVGQLAEWLVWSRLVATSGGDLHVFLPLDDRGIDGIVHRISTDGYARLQVKGRAAQRYPGIELKVPADEMVDDRAVLVAVIVHFPQTALGDRALVIDVPTYRQLAHREVNRGRVSYRIEVNLAAPLPRWAPWCVALDAIGERMLPSVAAPALAVPHEWLAARRLGYRAEMELLRRTADCPTLNVFKAFPDLEPNEYLLYETDSREILGIQVKSATFAAGATEVHVSVYRPALRPSPHTWFVVLLADHGATGFLPDCAVIPSMEVPGYLGGHGRDGAMVVTRGVTGHLAPWRVPLAALGAHLAAVARARLESDPSSHGP